MRPDQPKRAIIELDPLDDRIAPVRLYRLTENGREEVLERAPRALGQFPALQLSDVRFQRGARARHVRARLWRDPSHPFKIGGDVYSRHVWQPTLEYFLPVQMCHMRVTDKYRVWHGLDHLDDALMAPVDLNHFDGYVQGPSTLTRFKPGDIVPGLNRGGWHDAGDYDMRVESQIGTVWLLAKMVEEFGLDLRRHPIDQSAASSKSTCRTAATTRCSRSSTAC